MMMTDGQVTSSSAGSQERQRRLPLAVADAVSKAVWTWVLLLLPLKTRRMLVVVIRFIMRNLLKAARFQFQASSQSSIYSTDDGEGDEKKKRLVLDLNGLLGDINQDFHNAHLSHGRCRGKLVFKRPFCDDFLKFCFRNFDVGVWSSRLRVNVDAAVDILMKGLKHRLLFSWDASKCATGLYTLENKNKPLVLKELKKLWSKEEADDGLPWQQGDFRLYLESLATADDDVPSFVREHPFGQPSITESDPNWNFYKKIFVD